MPPAPADTKGTGGAPLSPTSSIDKDAIGTSSIRSKLTADGDDSTEDLLPPLDEKPRFSDLLFRRWKLQPQDLDATATRRSVFDDPILAKHYLPTERYENRHRFDPDARWTFREERVRALYCAAGYNVHSWLQAIVRKIDWRVMLWAAISFSAVRATSNFPRATVN